MLSHIELGDHVCWQVAGDRSWLRDAAAFVDNGVAANHRIVFLTSACTPSQVRSGLAERGLDVDTLVGRDQLQIADALSSFDPGGNADERIDRLRERCAGFHAAGYAGVRIITDQDWASDWIHDSAAGRTGPADLRRLRALVEYEEAINTVTADGSAAVVCVYEAQAFTRSTMAPLTAAHPGTLTLATPPQADPLLRIRRSGPLRLRFDGECDFSNRGAVAAVLVALSRAARDAGQPAAVDASQLRFADGAAARMLLEADAATPDGVAVEGGNRSIRSVLQLMHKLPTAPSAAPRPRPG
jgi:hypothetical protein